MAKELSTLTYNPGSQKSRVRLGRGQGSGLGKTAGRGTKGQKARSGSSKGKGFEGGQMPLRRRLPKFGFTAFNPVRYFELRISRLVGLPAGTVVDLEFLRANGIVAPSFSKLVKLIGNQDVSAALTVRLNAVSAGAKGSIERAGGVVEIVG